MSNWYWTTNEWATEEAKKVNIPLFKFVGVVAACSINTKWEINKVKAVGYFSGERKHLKMVLKKCEQVLNANSEQEIAEILRGDKLKSFYSNILHPGTSQEITIDRWALRDVFGEDIGQTPKRIREAKAHYTNIAKEKGILPHQAQAHAWENIRK